MKTTLSTPLIMMRWSGAQCASARL